MFVQRNSADSKDNKKKIINGTHMKILTKKRMIQQQVQQKLLKIYSLPEC